MIDPDLIARIAFVAAAVLLVLVVLIGGLVTSATGVWQDGERRIELWQKGPRLRGRCKRQGGFEAYAGWALYGRVWLSRRDVGVDLLLNLGFPPSALPEVSGRVTARFSMKLDGDTARGTFRGTRFHFAGEPQRLSGETVEAPVDRSWRRVG